MISLEKLKILTPLLKLLKNVGDLGNLIVAKGFKKLPNHPIWSHWAPTTVTCLLTIRLPQVNNYLLMTCSTNGQVQLSHRCL